MDEKSFSYANLANVAFLEDLYQKYQKDPSCIDPSWRFFFTGMDFVKEKATPDRVYQDGGEDALRLIEAYKKHGHKKVSSNPLQEKPQKIPELDFIAEKDLTKQVPSFGFLQEERVSLGNLKEALEKVFCSGIGFEVTGLSEELDHWFTTCLQTIKQGLSKEERLNILDSLIRAEVFETFIHTKYPGQTRFSLEGCETLVPMLEFLVEKSAETGVEEIVLGMPHRGRLNLLANVFKKSYFDIFSEFEEAFAQEEGSGDVKYHKGAHVNRKTTSGKNIEISMAPNPSHLESIDPVVEGKARAKQDLKGDPKKILPILLHGDASLAGQGVVYETLQMSRLSGYETSGTIHIVVNNHIGYTTIPSQSRSTRYPTDIAKAFGFPVFHVNAEKPEDCLLATLFAVNIRKLFGIDVFIDLGCYRKYGHNEGDEPGFTQPLTYQKIKKKKSVRFIFEEALLQEGLLSQEAILKKEAEFKLLLQEAISQVSVCQEREKKQNVVIQKNEVSFVPALSEKILTDLASKIFQVPSSFHLHSKLQRLLKERLKAVENKEGIDWGTGELLAYGSLLIEGITIRLSGQDVCRGTFAHRHAVFIDQENESSYNPLEHIQENQGACYFYNSPLSEFGVMGFDLGYSQVHPKALVLWEAQFGDFVNEAQVIIDQYLATSEQKWNHHSNLTLLLPHGYEGKGPEHSSARIERFLQLAAEENFTVANCTTPAQFFHLLRRQAYFRPKRPLIVFTPKYLLRHPSCVSSLPDFYAGGFQECLDDPAPDFSAQKILLCSGKIFYDLLKERKNAVIIRVEQLYPFPQKQLQALLMKYPAAKEVIWVQEEPKNMGAWHYVQSCYQEKLPLRYVGRKESASPAVGSYKEHQKQTEFLLKQAFEEGN